MDLNIEKALKFQFEDPAWKKKLGVLAVFLAVVAVFGILAYFGMFIPLLATGGSSTSGATATPDSGALFISMFSFGCLGLIFFLSMIFFSCFMGGYQVELIKAVMEDPDTKLPEASPVMSKVVTGFKQSLMHILPVTVIVIVYIVIIVISMLCIGAGAFSSYSAVKDSYSTTSSNVGPGALAIVGFGIYILGIIIYIVMLMLYTFFIAPAANYLFVKRGLGAIFAYGEMFQIAKKNWLNFLIVGGLTYAGSTILAFAMYIPCIGWVFYPFGVIVLVNAIAHLYGQVFARIDGVETEIKSSKVIANR